MSSDVPDLSRVKRPAVHSSTLSSCPAASSPGFASFFAQAQASRWSLSPEKFAAALDRSAAKRFAAETLSPEKLDAYLASLHLEDLALATACLENCESAWEHFVTEYRRYLRAAAAAVLRCSSVSPEACDLADSLFAELHGLVDGPGRERSLFRYFHGRSSLKTWLRAVLAQRHIDALRANRRFDSLDDTESNVAAKIPSAVSVPSTDPHRQRYAALFVRALQAALATLDSRDTQRLRLYYAEEQTLAEIGKQLREHESSVSRNLDRIRLALRRSIEAALRSGCPAINGFAAEPALSEAQIALCFEYAAADTPFDLDKLLQDRRPPSPAAGRPKT